MLKIYLTVSEYWTYSSPIIVTILPFYSAIKKLFWSSAVLPCYCAECAVWLSKPAERLLYSFGNSHFAHEGERL